VDEGWLYPVVDEPELFVHVPASLEIASTRSGDPDVSVAVVRGESPALPPTPYGTLELQLRGGPIGEAAVAAARALAPEAVVVPALFEGGHLRLELLGGSSSSDPAVLAELEAPAPVASNGLGSGRVVRRLGVEAALLLRDVLETGSLTFSAVAEMSMRGLADRVPVTASFDPRALAAAIAARADPKGRIEHDAIVEIWGEDGAVPFTGAEGLEAAERDRVARTLADWTVAAYGAPAASASSPVVATVRIDPAAMGDAPVTWDLSLGRTALRTVLLRLDPFGAAARLVAARGLDAVWRATVVPPLQTGMVSIEVDANLPAVIEGVAAAGVDLRAAPSPPHRVHALMGAALFGDPEPAEPIVWRLSPKEELRYEYTTFVMLHRGDSVRRLEGPPTTSGDRHLLLGAADLPIELLSVGAGPELLRQAVVRGSCGPEAHGEPPSGGGIAFELTAERPTAALALLPGEADAWGIRLEARPLAGGTSVPLGPLPPRSLELDVTSFPQFGPQSVEVSVAFDSDIPLVALELRSERDELAGRAPAVLSFTPAQPAKRWQYLSGTPFRSGYRYRWHEPGAAWSDVRPAGQALRVAASEVPSPPSNGGPSPMSGPEFSFEDVLCYPGDEPNSFLVVPTTALPELDGAGHPVVMSVPVAEGRLLQLGVQLGPRADTLERLRVEAARRFDIADPRLVKISMAPIEVEGASLAIDGGDGVLAEVARHGTSGFPPFSAIFSAALDEDRGRRVDEALAGRRDRATVTYTARVQRPAASGGRGWQPLRVSTDLATWLAPGQEDDR
jgi:hypothetical protein